MIRLAISILLAVIIVANPAQAQNLQDIAGPFGLPISSASLERFSKGLNLDPEQRQLARTLHQGYRGALRQALKAGNEEIKAIENAEDRDNRANKGMEVLDKFADRHQAIEQEFFSDLAAILTPEQAHRLDSVLRARRREVQMRFAFIAGEGVDLITLCERLKITGAPGSELATHLADYETAIDSLMIEKQKLMRASLRRAHKLMKNGMPDFQLVGSIITDLYALGGRVRDTNRRTLRLIDPLLTDDQRSALTAEVRALSFPRVYARTLAHKVLDAAQNLTDLTPQQTDDLKAVAASFTRDLEPINTRYAAAIESTQERFPQDFMIIMQMRRETAGDDPLMKARADREELMQSVFKRVRAIVGPESFAKLPQTDPDHNRFPDFLPNLRTGKDWEEAEEGDPSPR